MDFILNEWLLDYLCPDPNSSKLELINRLLDAIERKGDKIVIGRDNPFIQKYHKFIKKYSWNTPYKKCFTRLNYIFHDSNKTIIIEDTEIKQLPDEILQKVPPDDIYLIQLAYSTQDKIVITTDTRLKEKLRDITDLNICLLTDFEKKYLA